MSKIKLQWLWVVVGLEVLAIAGLLIWALALRQDASPPPAAAPSQQDTEPTYNKPAIALAQVVGGLTGPVAIAAMPSPDARLFVAEQAGTIRIVLADKTLGPEPLLDIKSKIKAGGEQGLLGLAFHPKVAENDFFYVNYTDKNGDTVIARYTISKESGRAAASTEKIILKQAQPYANHNGGDLTFGPDGYLYIGLGDGGSGGDPQDRAQNKNELLGKMLRIDVDGGDPYAIPADNPFAGGGGKPEIWALGLRNPWRFSFDRGTSDLFIADVGQGSLEEINHQPRGKANLNYGWRCFEGTSEFNTAGCQDASAYTKPIVQYDHTESRCSVTGGYVYRGTQFPALAAKYFYADYCSGQLYYAEQASGTWAATLAMATGLTISTFGQDNAGELYLADHKTGILHHITDTANP